jgi:hypothetical protein
MRLNDRHQQEQVCSCDNNSRTGHGLHSHSMFTKSSLPCRARGRRWASAPSAEGQSVHRLASAWHQPCPVLGVQMETKASHQCDRVPHCGPPQLAAPTTTPQNRLTHNSGRRILQRYWFDCPAASRSYEFAERLSNRAVGASDFRATVGLLRRNLKQAKLISSAILLQ